MLCVHRDIIHNHFVLPMSLFIDLTFRLRNRKTSSERFSAVLHVSVLCQHVAMFPVSALCQHVAENYHFLDWDNAEKEASDSLFVK